MPTEVTQDILGASCVVRVVRGGIVGVLWQIRHKLDASDPTNLLYNMYGYVSLGTHIGDEASDLLDAFAAAMVPSILSILSENTYHIGLEAIAVNDPTKFGVLPASVAAAGARVGDPAPRFVAWKYQLTRAVRGQRHGYKRYGAISETDITAGVPNAGVLDELEAHRLMLKEPLQFGAVDFWFPVILVRPPIDPETGLPEDVPWEYHEFVSAQVQSVTTQNTRKR